MRPKKISISLLFYLTFFGLTFGQTILRGKVLDKKTKTPIAYAKIGISDQGVGEQTNIDGYFVYSRPEKVLGPTSTLAISAPGYKTILKTEVEMRPILGDVSTIYLEQDKRFKKATKTYDKVSLFWDATQIHSQKRFEESWTLVQQFLAQKQVKKLEIIAIANTILFEETIKINVESLSSVKSQLLALPRKKIANYDLIDVVGREAVLLAIQDEPLFGEPLIIASVPVFPIKTTSSQENSYFHKIANFSDGKVLELPTKIVQNKNLIKTQGSLAKKIAGTVTSLNKPLQGARILRSGTLDEFLTDASGNFEIEVKEGDFLKISYLGMFSKEIKITAAETYDINLLPKNNVLDEVILEGKKTDDIIVGNRVLKGSNGTIRLDQYITADDIADHLYYLEDVIKWHFPQVIILTQNNAKQAFVLRTPISWYVDGIGTLAADPIPKYLYARDIESIILKTTLRASSTYGVFLEAAEKAFIITTKENTLAKEKYSPLAKGNEYNEELRVLGQQKNKNPISGKVVSTSGPIQGASLRIGGTFEEYFTLADGSFSIPVPKDALIAIDYLGMYPKFLSADDILKNPTIELIPKNDVLGEVTLNGKNVKEEEKVDLGFGKVSKDALGFASGSITSDEIKGTDVFITDILRGKFSGVVVQGFGEGAVVSIRNKPVKWIVDGIEIGDALSLINPQNVESITVVKNSGGAIAYGRGPFIFIKTKGGFSKKSEQPSALVSNNDYDETLIDISDGIVSGGSLERIKGIVKSVSGPIQGASILRKGSFTEVISNADGSFEIGAQEGDILTFSYLGMYPKGVIIEDISQKLFVELNPIAEVLDEVVLKGERRETSEKIITGYGKESRDRLGYAVNTVDEEDIKPTAQYVSDVLRGRFAGVTVKGFGSNATIELRPAQTFGGTGGNPEVVWVINNAIFQATLSEINEFVDPQNIASISILKSSAATNRYGSIAIDGAIVIKTKTLSALTTNGSLKSNSALIKGNAYQETVGLLKENKYIPDYIKEVVALPNLEEQFKKYQELEENREPEVAFYVDMAQYFQKHDLSLADTILEELMVLGKSNVKILRVIAYLFEAGRDNHKALLIYERIAKLAPQEAQSYRDLAMIYQEVGEYDKAFNLYINMLGEQIAGVNFDGLEKPLKSELSRLIALHKDKIDFARLPNQWLRVGFNIDLRMVIDWTDRNVPFEFQFVNPQKKFFKWTHTLDQNKERLVSEQENGYQTEEFIIDDAPSGNWLVNIQYLGEKSNLVIPPYLKYTVYRNYGTTYETKQIKVIKLYQQDEKVTLGKIAI